MRVFWAALCVAVFACLYSFPLAASPVLKLTWTVGLMSPQGPILQDVREAPDFASKEECDAFGEKMVSRMKDWVRGRVNQDWDFPVMIVWRCSAEGDPA